MDCPECGKKIPDGDDYCSYCGKKIKKSIPHNKIILFLIIILILIAISFVFISNSKNTISVETKELGSLDHGNVVREGPYGNTSSNVTIAYVVGHHPRENETHNVFLNQFSNNKDLKYCYYIYKINVTKGIDDYGESRMNGQSLAKEYVLPDAKSMNYSLVIDVHSNGGNWDENQFVYSPVNGSSGELLAHQLLKNCTFSTYYYPPNPTSHSYLTEPLNNVGIPAFYWEEYDQNTPEVMAKHLDALIKTVDNLKF